MSFRLVSKSVTLNDLERRNGRFMRYFSDFASFQCALRKMVEGIPELSATEIYPKFLVFSYILLMAIFTVDHPQRGR